MVISKEAGGRGDKEEAEKIMPKYSEMEKHKGVAGSTWAAI